MNCRELIEFLMDYLDGELPQAARRSFDAHLDACPYCVAYLASYRQTVRLGKMLCEPESTGLPDDVPDDLVEAILAARRALG